MKTRSIVTFAVLALCLALYAAGCQASLIQKTAQARTAFTGAIQAVDAEVVNGRIKVADYHKYIEPFRDAASGALDVMDAEASKDAGQWQAAFDSFNKALGELTIGKAKAESATAPTSAPTSRATLEAAPLPIEAGIPISEIIALLGIGITTVQKMVEEGRTQTTDEETAQLAAARATQAAAEAQLDADVAKLDQQQGGTA